MNFYDYVENPQCDSSAKLELIRARWIKAQHNLEEAKYLEKLILNDFVQNIKNTKTAWDYRFSAIQNARSEINKKKKSERKHFLFIEQAFKEAFFKDFDQDIQIKEIIMGGFEGYYWDFVFSFGENDFIIQIPVRDNINISNIKYGPEGKFVFKKYIESSCIEVLFEAWTEELLAKKLKEYFNDK